MGKEETSDSSELEFANTETSIEPIPRGLAPKELVGRSLGGCRLLSLIQSGAMGVVYSAHHIGLDREVALKIPFSGEASLTDEDQERFIREARLAAKLKHPNIVQVYNVGSEGSWLFIEMEKVDGPSLAAYVKEKGALPAEEAIKIGRALASALAYAHEKGVIHRDIKPHNILLDADGVPKLVDFGLAKILPGNGANLMASAIVGTPGYMAPEQFEAMEVDHRADIYGLGEVLYFMLTADHPFHGKSQQEVMRKHATDDYLALRKQRPDIDRRLTDLVETMMSADPEKRNHSAESVAEELDALSSGECRRRLAIRRGRRLLISTLTALIVVPSGVGFWLMLRKEPVRLDVKLMAQALDDVGHIKEFPVREGDVLRSGDNFRVEVEPDSKAYVCVLYYGSDGKPMQLFPSASAKGEVPAVSGERIELPSQEEWYKLGRTPGTETVYVLASASPITDTGKLLAEMADAGKKTEEEASDTREIAGIVADMHAEKKRIQRVTEVVRRACPNVYIASFRHE